jgi:hypothetical protein
VERAIDIGNSVSVYRSSAGGTANIAYNAYINTSGQYIYKLTAAATIYELTPGVHKWYTAPSGAAGNIISFTQAMTLDSSGRLLVGGTVAPSSASMRLLVANPSGDGYVQFANNSSGGGSIGAAGGAGLIFYSYTGAVGSETYTERARITSGGGMLVGTTTNTNSSLLVANGTISETVSSIQYLVASQFDIGTAPNKIPLNQYLGKLAYQDIPTSSSNIAGMGYVTGAGGAVTQATSRTTGVTINTPTGAITLVSAAGSTSWQSFTVTNASVAATDTVIVSQKSGTDLYQIFVTNVAAGSFRITFATTGGTTTEQPLFNFAVIKAVTA